MSRGVHCSGRVLGGVALLALLVSLLVLSPQRQSAVLGADSAGDRGSSALAVVEHPSRAALNGISQRFASLPDPPVHPFAASLEAEFVQAGVAAVLFFAAATAAIRSEGVAGSLWRRGERAPPAGVTA